MSVSLLLIIFLKFPVHEMMKEGLKNITHKDVDGPDCLRPEGIRHIDNLTEHYKNE